MRSGALLVAAGLGDIGAFPDPIALAGIDNRILLRRTPAYRSARFQVAKVEDGERAKTQARRLCRRHARESRRDLRSIGTGQPQGNHDGGMGEPGAGGNAANAAPSCEGHE